MQCFEKFTSHLLFLRKLLEDALYGNGAVNQETGRCRIQETGNPTQKRDEGILRLMGAERGVISQNTSCRGQQIQFGNARRSQEQFFFKMIESQMYMEVLRKLCTICGESEVKNISDQSTEN